MRQLSDESKAFYIAVYEEVQKIPAGKVTSYGHIAKLIYRPQNSRQVGQCLKYLPREAIEGNELSQEFNVSNVPWWRVISSSGIISPRDRTDGVRLQKQKLEEEAIVVTDQNRVSLSEYGWFPATDFDESDDD
ncbi:unnamed protein product [Kuraishia capsulata CBS 1993]|uniref:6-O-methylguanine-DNA methyltransferase n=1 Tax=Kuraishia capsulata CBS 1993 TaxID=1382522 RepID=W6MQV1_9ASCO|nr:uncharacterized protein KUCA_T00005101001 [Kuraishia capsulata CBS 1993]CDK29114.1 unnamed protein product [Kuraishia capsulata CBS 1993]